MEHRRSGLEKLAEDLHGAISDWSANECINSIWVGENATSRACDLARWANVLRIGWNLIQKSITSWGNYGANLGSIWLIGYFSYFHEILHFGLYFGGVRLSSVSRKAYDYDPHIFIFLTVPILWKNSTQSSEKMPYVNLENVCLQVTFRLFFKMLFKGEKCL